MTLNRLNQWFFPAGRMGDQVPAQRILHYEFSIKANYYHPIKVSEDGKTVEMEQTTAHLGPRTYLFHLYKISFPQEDLTMPGNRLEAALDRAGIPFRWMSEDELTSPEMNVSNTVPALLGPAKNLA